MNRKPGFIPVIILVGMAAMFAGSVAAPTLIVGDNLGGKLDKGTGLFGPGGTTCYIEDGGFSDTSITSDIDDIIEKLRADTRRASQIDRLQTETPDAKEFKYYIEQIVSKGAEKGINPAVAIGIWWGEQEFLHPEKAFGYKYYDSGTSEEVLSGTTEERWQKQLNGVYTLIEDAINNTGNYTQPAGENIITRLFYNYATAMQIQYKTNNVWSQSYKHSEYGNPYYKRLDIIKLLVPDLIICKGFGGVGIASGDFVCPVDADVASAGAKGGWGNVIGDNNYQIGTYVGHEGYDLMSAIGTNIYSASNGKVVAVSEDSDGDGQSATSVTIEETTGVYWYYTHLQKPTVSKNDTVVKGDKIAEVGEYTKIIDGQEVAANHLHLGISKRLDDRATRGSEYRWDAWYYPYEFLRHIDCLQPPIPGEVSYP